MQPSLASPSEYSNHRVLGIKRWRSNMPRHRDGDEYPRAYITLKPGKTATKKEIVDYMKGKVAPTKRITGGVVFVDAIPRNPSGKILRKVLRERAAQETKQGVITKL